MIIKFANHKNEIERQIIVLLVEDILAAGYAIEVNDGEEDVLPPSRDEQAIFKAMSTTDEERLFLYEGPNSAGWIRLIYGNDGYVISDFTTNLEKVVEGGRADELAKRFQ